MIQTKNISRRYGDFTAVDNVTFTITEGEIVGLLGHNGAGKTTIMKMLTGYIEPSSGEISINGEVFGVGTTKSQQLIGYLPENLPIYPEMTVMDYLLYCAQMRNIPAQDIDARVCEAISKTELASKALNLISTLSRGFRQRVGVAQALIHNPKILILDEPTNGLDPHQTQQMRRLIRGLAKQSTVIISTHIMQEVDALCDRVLILDGGQLAIDQSMEALRRSDSVALNTSADLDTVNAALAGFYIEKKSTHSSPAQKIKRAAKGNHYTLHVGEGVDVNELCDWMSQDLIKNNESLYAIHPLLRDLERVFHAIHQEKHNKSSGTNQEEMSNVA